MPEAFLQLSITLGIALVVSLIMKLLKQPLIIGYIITGIIVGPALTGVISDKSTLEAFSHIGVALLLFIVGLGLKPKLIKEIGKVAVLAGLMQIIITALVCFGVSRLLGFSSLVSFYLGVAFTFSSTIIILRMLFNKGEQDTLHGRISIGFLLVQDLVAMILFIVISSFNSIGTGNFLDVAILLISKFVLVIFCLYLIMKFITPRVDKIFAENKELLFIFSIGVCFVVATLFYKLGFSLELGALAAGVILSMSPYQREIAVRIQSLRDFFLIIFFIVIGANVYTPDVRSSWSLVLIFSLSVLILNPIIMFLILRILRYTVKTSFLAGLSASQVSEFSLILLGIGVGLGHLPAALLGPVTLVALITIAISTYYVTYNHGLYNFWEKPLHFLFGDKNARREGHEIDERVGVVLFGCHITGGGLIDILQKNKVKFLAIDHDPSVIKDLIKKEIPCLYGSADDADLLDTLPMKTCKLIISTVPDLDVNLFLVAYMKKLKRSANVICVASHFADAEKLYKLGASYVIMPPYLGRRFITDLFRKNKFDHKKYLAEKERHILDYHQLGDRLV